MTIHEAKRARREVHVFGTKWGVFRTGLWYDWAYTDRYQVPSNILTGADTEALGIAFPI